MPLDAGAVTALLGGTFSPAGFAQFDGAMKRSTANAQAFESGVVQSQKRASAATVALNKATKIAALGTGAAIVGATMAAANFNQKLSELKAVSQASAKQMDLLRASALKAGKDTKFSAGEAAAAQVELAKGGMSVKDMLAGGLNAALALAAAGNIELADAASYTVNAMNLFNIRGKEAGKIADMLATAANTTTADVSDFGMALTQGGSAAKQAGLSFKQTIVWLEALASIGVKNSDAGTSMKSAIVQLIGPTKKQAEAQKALGLSFVGSNGKMKSMGTIAKMLKTELGGMTDAQRMATLKTLAGTDGFRALAALYDAGGKGVAKFSRELGKSGTAAEVARVKQNNLKGDLEQLMGSIETAAIEKGDAFQPLARSLAQAARAAVDSGAAFKALEVIVAMLAGRAAALGAVWAVGKIAAFAGAVKQAAMALALLRAGATMSVVSMTALAGPIGMAVAAVGVLAYTMGAFGKKSDEAADAARRTAESIRDIRSAQLESTSDDLAAAKSKDRVRDAQSRVNKLRAEGKTKTREYRDAQSDLSTAQLESAMATDRAAASEQKRAAAVKGGIKKAVDDLSSAENKRAGAMAMLQDRERKGDTSSKMYRATQAAVAATTRDVAVKTKNLTRVIAEGSVATLNDARIKAGVPAITKRNASAIAALAGAISGLPKSKQTKILLSGDQSVAARIGKVIQKANGIVPQKRIRAIMEGDGTMLQKIRTLKAELDRLRDKQVAVRVTTWLKTVGTPSKVPGGGTLTVGGKKFAHGATTGNAGMALVGEGGGPEWIVDSRTGQASKIMRPTIAQLSPHDAVIPTESRYRDNATAIMADLLGLPGFSGGKKSKKKRKKKLPIPKKIDSLSLPLDDFESRESKAGQAYDAAKSKVASLESDKKLKGKENTKKRLAANRSMPAAKRRAAKLRAELLQRRKEVREAKRYAARIKAEEDEIEIARQNMQIASGAGDEKAYGAARGKRNKSLGDLRRLTANALSHVRANTPYHRELLKALGATDLNIQEAATDEAMPTDPETDTPLLTAAQQQRLEDIEAQIALASLTDDANADDTVAVSALVAFRQGILDAAQASGMDSASITEAAQAVKSARDQLSGLKDGGPSDDANLSAQLEQQRQRTANAENAARLSEQALAVFGGAGDIGAGGKNALAAAGSTININTLHPGDSRTLSAIGKAASGGFALQGSRQTPRQSSGY